MRIKCLLVLLALTVSVISPLTIHVSTSDKQAIIIALDVCHASGDTFSVNAETPVVHECFCNPAPLEISEFVETCSSSFASSIFSVQIEQPPRI